MRLGMTLQGKTALAGVLIAGLLTAGCAHKMQRSDLVMDSAPCADTTFTIYFGEGSDQLTKPAHELIEQTAQALQRCTVTAVEVVGLADASGSQTANFDLSQRRARSVVAALNRSRLPTPRFTVSAGGDLGAKTAGGEDEPIRRRAEVTLRVAPGVAPGR
jgi:peptidoglycan-associated lipoprotein